MNPVPCSTCGKMLESPHSGMNLPDVTDGPQYWCDECTPWKSDEDFIQALESMIVPPKEMKNGC